MLVVNLFGAPGSGKSTGAAYIFSQLKMKGLNAEYVTEYAKDKVWERSKKVFNNQAYIFGKQYFRMSRLEEEVDVIITDSPLLLSAFYNNSKLLGKDFNNMVYKVFNSYNSLNFMINRVKPYNSSGRMQTEEQSNKIKESMKYLLDSYNVDYMDIDGDKNGYDAIVNEVLEELNI